MPFVNRPPFVPAAARRLAPLTLAATMLIAALAVVSGPAQAATSGKGGTTTHTITAEISPDGTVGTPVKAGPGKAPADGLRALCASPPQEYGDWVNADPAATGIARIELRDCQPVTTCSGDICTIVHDAGWRMHVFGKCTPTNCDWGWSAGQFRLSSGHIYGFYDQGFAKRYVYAMMSQYRPGQLWVYWRTDFTDPNRADYEKQEWFVRA